MHDASKVLMGSTQSSDREVSNAASDPATFPAGLAVRRKSDSTLSVSSSDGQLVGVSLGKSLSDTKKTAVCRVGNRVPLQLPYWNYLTEGDLRFEKKRNVAVAIEFLDTESAGAETVTVTGDDDSGYLISVGMEEDVATGSTATQLKAALDADTDASALISTTITGTASNHQSAFAEDDIDSKIAVIGGPVRVSNTTGQAVLTSGTLTGAQYASECLTGIQEDESEIPVALIDMGGGL